jgi:succinoglycan biosynthesis protein ExoL
MTPSIVFFGHDALDAAIRRRIKAFKDQESRIVAFTMRRGPPSDQEWENIDLGRTYDANFAQRLVMLAGALPILVRHRARLARADIYYARNLDMLMLANVANLLAGTPVRIVYECLDVHRLLGRANLLGAILRRIERALLKRSALLVVSSPAFTREYFDVQHRGCYRAMLIENRLPRGYTYGPRPALETSRAPARPIRIGWFGNLRCRRSLSLLLATAERYPNDIEIIMRGAPARTELPDFEAKVAALANVGFGGRYEWPHDLPSLFASVDLVWAGDFHDPGANSAWLLPNRLYEGGYYGVPPVAPAESETGRWIASKGFGFTLSEPLEVTVPTFLGSVDRAAIDRARETLLAASDGLFVQPPSEIKELLKVVMAAD